MADDPKKAPHWPPGFEKIVDAYKALDDADVGPRLRLLDQIDKDIKEATAIRDRLRSAFWRERRSRWLRLADRIELVIIDTIGFLVLWGFQLLVLGAERLSAHGDASDFMAEAHQWFLVVIWLCWATVSLIDMVWSRREAR